MFSPLILAKRLGFVIVAGMLLPAAAHACSYGGPPLSEAQIDEMHRGSVERLAELFEAEVLKVDGLNSEMRVIRVFRGQLRPGMVLRGQPAWHSCMTRELHTGDRGFVLVTFGPNGPSFVGEFLNNTAVRSLKRIGALPAD